MKRRRQGCLGAPCSGQQRVVRLSLVCSILLFAGTAQASSLDQGLSDWTAKAQPASAIHYRRLLGTAADAPSKLPFLGPTEAQTVAALVGAASSGEAVSTTALAPSEKVHAERSPELPDLSSSLSNGQDEVRTSQRRLSSAAVTLIAFAVGLFVIGSAAVAYFWWRRVARRHDGRLRATESGLPLSSNAAAGPSGSGEFPAKQKQAPLYDQEPSQKGASGSQSGTELPAHLSTKELAPRSPRIDKSATSGWLASVLGKGMGQGDSATEHEILAVSKPVTWWARGLSRMSPSRSASSGVLSTPQDVERAASAASITAPQSPSAAFHSLEAAAAAQPALPSSKVSQTDASPFASAFFTPPALPPVPHCQLPPALMVEPVLLTPFAAASLVPFSPFSSQELHPPTQPAAGHGQTTSPSPLRRAGFRDAVGSPEPEQLGTPFALEQRPFTPERARGLGSSPASSPGGEPRRPGRPVLDLHRVSEEFQSDGSFRFSSSSSGSEAGDDAGPGGELTAAERCGDASTSCSASGCSGLGGCTGRGNDCVSPGEITICRRPDGSRWALGRGAYGRVYRGLRDGVQDVAVKVLRTRSEGQQEEFRREVAILQSCHDTNVVQFLGACLQPGNTMLVTEFMAGGDLRAALSGPRGVDFQWYRGGKRIAVDAAKGLHFLHSRRIIHLDLKSSNVLLSENGSPAKIADVGMAAVMSRSQEYIPASSRAMGTFAWAAPELLTGAKCCEKADIYSFGIMLWEIATRETPMRGLIRDPRVPEECPEALDQLINRCLDVSPEKRPSAKELHEALKAC